MALIKHRPEILVYVPQEIVPGASFKVRAVIDCRARLPVSGVEIELMGVSVWMLSSQQSRYRDEEQFFRSVARVRGAGPMGPGRHEFSARFRLPPDVPASYAGEALRIEYTVRVKIGIPWWPDASASFHLVVVSARSSAADEQRVIYTSGVHALQQHRPYVEMSLGSSALRPGGVLRGVVALSNVTHLHYRGMAVELVAVERYPALFGVQTHHRRSHTWVIPVEAPGDGQPIHFALSLPGNIVPGFTCGRCSLEWYLVLRVDVAWAPSARMWVPVVVLGRRGAEQSEQRAPLAVGAERLDLVWRDVATRTGFLYDGGALTGQIDGVEVRVTRERRGRNGAYLVAMLRYPDLGIGLSLAGAAPCVRLLGRDQGQVSWLARALGQVVSRCPVVAADDREMRCELPDNGQRARTVLGFVEGARALASALAQAVPGIPAPACMAAMVPAWERTARALGGRLHPAPMRIEAATDEMPFELRTDWDEYGRPARTVIELRPASKIDVRYRLQWSAQDGVEGLDLRELSLSDLCVGARGLAIDEGRIRLFLPGPLVDPAAEMKRVATLVWLGHRLSGRVGVYR